MRTRVKICGFTLVEDALFAAQIGVDAVGLVFYAASPRNVSIAQAQAIVRALPAFVSVVGLFVDAEVNWVTQVLSEVNLDCLQFHGDESGEECRRFKKPYIKAIRVQPGITFSEVQEQYHDASGLLLDAYHPGIQGGTGSVFDWDLIPKHSKLPIILAGGLSIENAALAVRQVKPYALDVSSGVEVSKGIKDAEKMAAFIRTINQTT